MRRALVVAAGAVSALGRGEQAYSVGDVGERPLTRVARDPALESAGLLRPNVARAVPVGGVGCTATRLLRAAAEDLASDLDASLPRWRGRRVAIVVGTSSGGLESFSRAMELRGDGTPVPREVAREATYFGPLVALSALGVADVPVVQVLAACASSTVCIGLACRWLDEGSVDLVIAGGYDGLATFVAAGFEALHATTATVPRPFRRERDGLALGEGAALLALAREWPSKALGSVLGFGAASDAVHITSPDRSGDGLARAASRALEDAALAAAAIDQISAHGTATAYNDAAEAAALRLVFGEGRPLLHAFKGVVGHTLGAAGALETLAALDAIARGVAPGTAGAGSPDPEAPVVLGELNVAAPSEATLKLSAAFGGANAALVVGGVSTGSSEPREERRAVCVEALGRPVTDGAAPIGGVLPAGPRIDRLDPVSALVVRAALEILHALPAEGRRRTGIVLATVAATLEIDERFDRRRRERGARFVEPRRFPPTSPNVACGECSIALGLGGPSFAVGAGPRAGAEAVLCALDLVAAGDAERVVIVAADEVGGVVEHLWAQAGSSPPRHGARAAVVGPGPGPELSRSRIVRALTGPEPRVAGWPVLESLLAPGA